MVAVCPAVKLPETPAIVNSVILKLFPSISVSLFKTLPETGISSGVTTISFDANGASFTAATTISINPVSVPPLPSETV